MRYLKTVKRRFLSGFKEENTRKVLKKVKEAVEGSSAGETR
jgi:hypothetical protein